MEMRRFALFALPLCAAINCGPPSAYGSTIKVDMDAQDHERISKLAASELEQLQGKLREAMSLYYDNAYALSLPVFRDIAAKLGTLDVLYWYGSAAQRSGQVDLAISKFKSILERHPEMHNVRMDLAKAYVQKGEIGLANKEIERVRAAAPSDEVRKQLDGLIAMAAEPDKRHYLNLRFASRIQYDDNINAQPEDSVSNFSAPKVEGGGVVLSGSADYLYDFGEIKGNAWRSRLSLYSLDHSATSSYDYLQTDIQTGIEHYGERLRVKVPVGFVDRQFGHANLSNSWYVNPEVSLVLREDLDLKVDYRLEDEKFDTNKGENNLTHTMALGPSWLFKQKGSESLTMVSLQAILSNKDARAESSSYTDLGFAPSLFLRFDSGVETFFQLKHQNRDYNGNTLLAGLDSPVERTDGRWTATAQLSKTFDNKYVVSSNYSYINNKSNDDRYDYSKSVVGLNLGVNLNY